MRDRVRLALDLAPAGTVPPRFEAAYRRGGTPTNLHLAILAQATGTTPAWLMTGHPEEHALPTAERNTAMPKQPDEQHGDEPTAAHYQRADADKMPTTPAGQQAAIEGMLAARGYADRPRPAIDELLSRARLSFPRNVPAEPPTTPPTAAGRLAADMLALVERFEQERRAEIRAAGSDRDEDDAQPLDPGYLRWIADEYERTRDNDAGRERLLDLLADELALADIRILRLAAEAAVAATPRAIKAAKGRGMKPAATADELGLTPSRVYQVLRELDAQQREQPPADGTGGHEWHHPTPSAGLRCRRCDLAHKEWSGEDCPAVDQ
jgi:hypothetical protein